MKAREFMDRAIRVALLLAFATCLGASAIDSFDFPDPEAAARYQRLLAEFRCPKCLNESLASSGAPIAVDLRRAVRRLMEEGESDAAIRAYLQQRYGDFVLYDPPLKASTWLLWFSPVLLLAVVVGLLVRAARRRAPAALSEVDSDRVRRLLDNS
ncbi:MAG: cytochrome c-type biogenesis protein CcmH [Gammaproteobacteria bacterium]|nr:cytochrome c-type biogenesis protein CcmH [Gammaproteobacteria bacterium]